MNQIRYISLDMAGMCALIAGFGTTVVAKTEVTLNDFYPTFELSEITPENMQSWPYYRYTSMNWEDNAVAAKLIEMVDRALFVFDQLGAE